MRGNNPPTSAIGVPAARIPHSRNCAWSGFGFWMPSAFRSSDIFSGMTGKSSAAATRRASAAVYSVALSGALSSCFASVHGCLISRYRLMPRTAAITCPSPSLMRMSSTDFSMPWTAL